MAGATETSVKPSVTINISPPAQIHLSLAFAIGHAITAVEPQSLCIWLWQISGVLVKHGVV